MVKHLANRYWWLLPICIVVASVLVAGRMLQSEPGAGPAPAALVDCATERPDDYDCWRDRLWRLVEQDSPAAALADARVANDQVPFVTRNCHQFAHEIGRAAGHKYGDVAEAYANGDDFCASGYFHGVMEAIADLLGEETLFAQVDDVCADFREERPYALEHYNCVHGLGHGLMAVTYAELFRALDGCDGLTDGWERESCLSGVFMENIMAKDNPHHTTAYLRDDEPLYPCTDVDDSYKQGCYIIQSSHALSVVGYDFAAVFDLCLSIEAAFQTICIQSLGRDVSGHTLNDVPRTVELCMLGPDEFAQENCFIGAAKDYVYHFHNDTEGLELCAAIEDPGMSGRCTETIEVFYRGL